MLGLKVPVKDAEKWKVYLTKNELFDKNYRVVREKDFLYYPLTQSMSIIKGHVELVEKEFPKSIVGKTLKEQLQEQLSEEDMKYLQTAHDVVGDIAILEIPEELIRHEKYIAEALLKTNPNIKTVLKKAASHEGTFRTQKMQFLAGMNKKETIHKENNVMISLDLEKIYFSVRLSEERKRIAKKVKPGETVLVMFSGCAPYPLVIARNAKPKYILGIEINPIGHEYGLKNIKLNKFHNIELLCGDVKDIIPELLKQHPDFRFDRIVMPLPKTADEYLTEALMLSKKGTTIHFYDFLEEDKFELAQQKIAKACKKAGMKFRIHDTVKCGQHSPRIYRICVDFEIV